jgi:hypothetical protein
MKKLTPSVDVVLFSSGYEDFVLTGVERKKTAWAALNAELPQLGLEILCVRYEGDEPPTAPNYEVDTTRRAALFGGPAARDASRALLDQLPTTAEAPVGGGGDSDEWDLDEDELSDGGDEDGGEGDDEVREVEFPWPLIAFRRVDGGKVDEDVLDRVYSMLVEAEYCSMYSYRTSYYELDDGVKIALLQADAEMG